MERIISVFRQLVERTETTHLRYLYHQINWDSRLTAIVGARGVGKTTLLLQRIKLAHNQENTIYVNADDIYFAENKLYDFAVRFYQLGGRYLFIDEVHKYANWSKEIKMLYDYLPDLFIVFTGSSILDIYKGSDDLSRRALTYLLMGLSFREYVNMKSGLNLPSYSLQQIIQNEVKFPSEIQPLYLFKKYLEKGYFPFFDDVEYSVRLNNILNLTLEVDVPIYAGMNVATSRKIKQLLYIISQSVPFKPNFSKIATMIDVHRNQVVDFLYYLEKVGIVIQLRNQTQGIRLLGKVEKVFLGNTNLIAALGNDKQDIGNLRDTFFINQMQVMNEVFASDKADFKIGDFTFEVGGKNKSKKQIAHIENSYIVKDDIEYGFQNVIPLWTFGFNY
jgi:predicted AAA+ superfamily ATPase